MSGYHTPGTSLDLSNNITGCHGRLRWLQNYDIPCSPCFKRKTKTAPYGSKGYTNTSPNGGANEVITCARDKVKNKHTVKVMKGGHETTRNVGGGDEEDIK